MGWPSHPAPNELGSHDMWIIQNFGIIIAATVAVFAIVAACEWLGGN